MKLRPCLLFLSFTVTGTEASSFRRPVSAFAAPRKAHLSSKCFPRIAPSLINHGSETNARQCDTALNMGLRSFLSKKVLKRKDDEDGDDDMLPPKDTPAPIPSEAEVQEETPVKVDIDDPVTVPDTISAYEHESVQDRVKRLKSGKMTDAEKDRFLQTALSASNVDMPKTPLRQRVPSSSDKWINRRKESASPFPKDSIMKNTFSGSSAELDSDKKKREYLAMVTNPDRFKGYVTPTATEEPSAPIDSFISDDDEGNDAPGSTPSTPIPPPGSAGLGSRLEAAASAEEIRKRDLQKQQEASRQKQLQKMAEMQRIRNDEIAKREAEALQKKQEIEAAAKREEEEHLRAEELRRQEMQAAQDAYWASKLQEEREAQRAMVADEERKEKQKKRAEEREAQARKVAQERLLQSEPIVPDTPEVPGVQPESTGEDMTFSSYLREQAVEKATVDKTKDTQLELLRALNSPLPSPPKAPSPSPAMQVGRNVSPPPKGGSSIADFSKKPATETTSRAKSVGEVMTELDDDMSDDDVEDSDKGSGSGMFGRLLGNQKKPKTTEESTQKKKPVRQKLPDPGPTKKKVVRQQLPDPGADKKPVRQELPLGDDDFDNFSRNGPNKNVSIRDAMKKSGGLGDRGTADQTERSKKWGVDISKFQDD